MRKFMKRLVSILLVIVFAVGAMPTYVLAGTDLQKTATETQSRNVTSNNFTDFDVEMYIADLWTKAETEEIKVLSEYVTNLNKSPEHNRADYMAQDATFYVPYFGWRALNGITSIFSGDISAITDIGSMVNGNNKELYFTLLLGLLQQLCENTENAGNSVLSLVSNYNEGINLYLDVLNQFGEAFKTSEPMSAEAKLLIESDLEKLGILGEISDLVGWVSSLSVSFGEAIEYTKIYAQVSLLGERAKNYLNILKTKATGSPGLEDAIDDLLMIFEQGKNPANFDIKLGHTVYDIFCKGVMKLCEIEFPTYKVFTKEISNVLLFYNLLNAGFDFLGNAGDITDKANTMLVLTYLETNIALAFQTASSNYANTRTKENAQALLMAADMLFAVSDGGAMALQGYRQACANAIWEPIGGDAITVGEAQNIGEHQLKTSERISETLEVKEFVHSNWRKVLKKEHRDTYNYLFDIPTITDPRGDDGDVNWDFIVPVRHRKTVPAGWTGIYTAEDLDNIRNNLDGNYILMNDIDLSPLGNWTPLGGNITPIDIRDATEFEEIKAMYGTYARNDNPTLDLVEIYYYDSGAYDVGIIDPVTSWSPYSPDKHYAIEDIFSGHIEGNGYVIKNFKINDSDYNKPTAGLIGRASSFPTGLKDENGEALPRVSNLGLDNVEINISTLSSISFGTIISKFGFLGLWSTSVSDSNCINNCFVSSGSIKIKDTSDRNQDNAYASFSINGISGDYTYGIFNCYNQADIEVHDFLGGNINGIGCPWNSIENCFNLGDLTATNGGDISVSGICNNYRASSQISKSANWGNISLYKKNGHAYSDNGAAMASGVGPNAYTNCFNAGNVYAQADSTVDNYPSSSSVRAYGVGFHGGGGIYKYGTATSYNYGSVVSRSQGWRQADGSIQYYYGGEPFVYQTIWDHHIFTEETMSYYLNNHVWHYDTPSVEYNGQSISELEFTNKKTFSSFDFDTIWDINPNINKGRPFIRNLIPAWREADVQPIDPDCGEGSHQVVAIPLELDETSQAIVSKMLPYKYYTFTPTQTDEYIFETLNKINTAGFYVDEYGTATISMGVKESNETSLSNVYQLTAGEKYIFYISYSDSSLIPEGETASISFKLKQLSSVAEVLKLGTPTSTTLNGTSQRTYFQFTPATSGKYSLDVLGNDFGRFIYGNWNPDKGSWDQLYYVNRSIDGGMRYELDLQANKTYYIYFNSYLIQVPNTLQIQLWNESNPPHTHTYEDPISTPPTCTTQGFTSTKCTSCDYTHITYTAPPLGHKTSDWIIVKEATVTEVGLKEKHCTVCSEVLDSETLPKLDLPSVDVEAILQMVPESEEFTKYTADSWVAMQKALEHLNTLKESGATQKEIEDAASALKDAIDTLVLRISTTRLAGKDRFETANEVANYGWESSEYAIITSSKKYVGGLAGVPLAKALDAPIFLVKGNSLAKPLKAELQELGVETIYILGDKKCVSKSFEKKLIKQGYNVVRLEGSTQSETAVAIAKELKTLTGNAPQTIYIANAEDYQNTAAGSVTAAINGSPILFVNKNGSMDEATKTYLRSLGVAEVKVLGRTDVIGGDLETLLAGLGINNVTRISASDGYEMSLEVNNVHQADFNADSVAVATGENFPDAIVGAALCAKFEVPLFLLNDSTSVHLSDYALNNQVGNVYVYGGTKALSENILNRYIEG